MVRGGLVVVAGDVVGDVGGTVVGAVVAGDVKAGTGGQSRWVLSWHKQREPTALSRPLWLLVLGRLTSSAPRLKGQLPYGPRGSEQTIRLGFVPLPPFRLR